MPSVHYRFGGSTADRTLNCAAWACAVDKLPKINRTSAAAERGTAMHDVMEASLLKGVSVDAILAEKEHDFDEYDIEHLRAAERGVKELIEKYDIKEYACETLMSVTDDVGGSADFIGSGDTYRIVLDFKFGRQPVPADSNSQLLFYDFLARNTPSVADLMEAPRLVGAIIQPAVSFAPDVYEFDTVEVSEFEPRMIAAIEAARIGGEARAGSHCAFCANEPYCEAKRKQVKDALRISIEQAETLASAGTLLPQLKSFIAAVEDELTGILKEGLDVPGFKLVHKRAIRKWDRELATDIELLELGLERQDFINVELATPAQVERVIKAKKLKLDISGLLDTTPTELTYAPDSDKREKIIVEDVARSKLSAILANK